MFKGGTALQKTGVVPRFSEDLDFTQGESSVPLRVLRGVVVEALRNYGVPCEADQLEESPVSSSYRLRIEGPLYRARKGWCTVRVEVSHREPVLRPPDRRELSPPYSDILPYVVEVEQLAEILSEKVRALCTRQKARDLFDL